MAEFGTKSTTDTYVNASGSVAIDVHGVEVRKVKPAGATRDGQHAFGLGNLHPVAIITGPFKPENPALTVSLRVWQTITTALTDWATRPVSINVTYKLPTGETCPINHSGALILGWKHSEADASAAGEALVDLEYITARNRTGSEV
jgi:hypothetical protein